MRTHIRSFSSSSSSSSDVTFIESTPRATNLSLCESINAQHEHRFSITKGRFIVVAQHLFLAIFATMTTTFVVVDVGEYFWLWLCMHRYVYLFWMNFVMSTSNSTDSFYQIICLVDTSKRRQSAIYIYVIQRPGVSKDVFFSFENLPLWI